MSNVKEVSTILKKLKKIYPPYFYSTNKSPFYVLISTILSQRAKDEQTLKAAQQLFSKFKTPEEIANANINIIKRLIKPSGFYNVKAKRVKDISKIIVEKYGGKVPNSMEELLKLPGVGYKTGACVIVYGFNKPEIPVDIHVAVMSQRLGLTQEKNPNKIRFDLMKEVPKRYWLDINELFVRHGQSVCLTRKPRCEICIVSNHCDYYHKSDRNDDKDRE